MNTLLLIRTSTRVLRKHILRSVLTVIGIMIGIAAIIATFSIGHGAQVKVRQQIMAMGQNAIYIIPGNLAERGSTRPNISAHLKDKDVYAITKQCPEVREIARCQDSVQEVIANKNTITEPILACEPNYLHITENKLKNGSFFNEFHSQHRTNVAVLGSTTATKLFNNEDPVGQSIRIKGKPFTVIGVLAPLPIFGAHDDNARVYIPYSVGKKYLRQRHDADDDVNIIVVGIKKGSEPGIALRKIKRTLRFMHKLSESDTDDFTIFDQESIAETADAATGVIELFGLIAASISLLVGGIGVMNIMLVSVRERTREIGIRLAIGATRRNIQLQFLFESVSLSMIGGLMGVALGSAIHYAISSFTNLPGSIELLPLLIAFFATILTGIFFGYYPARQASRMNPVDALLNKK